MRGSEAVVKALEQEGIRYISGFAGGGLAPLWGPLRASTVRPFAARNERLGVEIADGYARATGEVGVAMTGTGPGATNCLTGIAGCYADNVPVLLLMGQHPCGTLARSGSRRFPPASSTACASGAAPSPVSRTFPRSCAALSRPCAPAPLARRPGNAPGCPHRRGR